MRISADLRLILGATAILASLLVMAASATTYQAGPDLQAAIDGAEPGDTVLAGPGLYEEVEIAKSISLVGTNARIRAGERDIGIKITADDVTVSGFTVEGGFYGIHLVGSDNCTISDNSVTGSVQWGIGLVFSDDNRIEKNIANYNGLGGEGWYGIYLSNSNRNLIQKNVASNNGEYGIALFPSCSENVIRENTAEDNDYGIYAFTDCDANLIMKNRLSRNKNSGIKLIHGCSANQILENDISENGVVGLFLQSGSGYNLIRGNEIAGNSKFGVQIQEGPDGNNTILENNISGSQKGIFVDTDGNTIYKNRIFDCVIPAEDRGANQWYAAYPEGGNFWGTYIGTDEFGGPGQNISGSDGFADLPRIINERARDLYPIMGDAVLPLVLVDASIHPARATIGTQVTVEAVLESRYGVAQISARTRSLARPSEPSRYIRMEKRPGDDVYVGTLQTALMGEGRHKIILSAKDAKGYEVEEEIGELELSPRSGWDFNEALSKQL
ncbi:right-handed parallel beta-helix repeat-containing protein [Methanocrinis sp.]|uniref:right-handed parallel beta-helix repeat-containing protein n=1 Tax=Methanocrinis sp. TaxID=3101522 RepID=UPI003D0B768A